MILEGPVLPVAEGDAVTLSCRNKTSSSSVPAVFYKDGLFIGISTTGNMTIHTVYKSHEGLYRCNISGEGESPGSWLAVRGETQACFIIKALGLMLAIMLKQILCVVFAALHREACPCSDHFMLILLLLRTVSTVVMVALLLLLVGLLHCGKHSELHKNNSCPT